MFERVVCNSSARLERDTLTTVASIWERNAPSTATDEILQRCERGCAVSSCSSLFDAIRFSRGVAAVETTEEARTHEADKQKTQPQSRRRGNGAQAEVSDA